MKVENWTKATIGLMAMTCVGGLVMRKKPTPVVAMFTLATYMLAGVTALCGTVSALREEI